jgi:hypothetical protein
MKNKKNIKAAPDQSDSFKEIKQVFTDHLPADIAESLARLLVENIAPAPEENQKPVKKEKPFHTALFLKDEGV